jgi:uncharacterized protein YciI
MRRLLMYLILLALPVLAQPVPVHQFLLRYEPVRKDFNLQNLTVDEGRIVGEHVAYLRSLQADGKLMLAGQVFDANRGFWGILIVNTSDPEAAGAVMKADPAIQQKIVRGEVIPFRTVLLRPPDPPAK